MKKKQICAIFGKMGQKVYKYYGVESILKV